MSGVAGSVLLVFFGGGDFGAVDVVDDVIEPEDPFEIEVDDEAVSSVSLPVVETFDRRFLDLVSSALSSNGRVLRSFGSFALSASAAFVVSHLMVSSALN